MRKSEKHTVIDYAKYGVTDRFLAQFEFPGLKPLKQDWRWSHKYCYDILKGNIPSCKKLQWAALRHFRDLQRDDVYFDEDAADEIVRWFKYCPITKSSGRYRAGQPTTLDPSQIFILTSLIAWRWSDDKFETIAEYGEDTRIQVQWAHTRRYNQFYGQVSRKYGKTSLMAGLMLYLMKKSDYNPHIFSLATKKDQAKIVWDTAKKMISLSPQLKKVFKSWANYIETPATEGTFRALASDSNSLDGLDPIAACLDECHAIKDRNLYGVLISAFGANVEYLFAVITTAGFILQGLCTDLYKNGSAVLDPDNPAQQDNYFYAIFEIDQGDDWSNEKAWFKSNPALVYGRPGIQYMRNRFNEALMSTEEKANFITKHCNLFINGSDKWLNMDDVYNCYVEDKVFIERLAKYKDKKCYIGFDRSKVNDITSFSILYPDEDGGLSIDFINLLPENTVKIAGAYLGEVYRKAIERGDLITVKTPTIRDFQIEGYIRKLYEELKVEGFYYDPWHMREIGEKFEDEGYPMVAVSNGTGNMSEPAKKLEGLIQEGLLRYNNSLFEYACSCAIMKMTDKSNIDIKRDDWKTDKIDPLIATILGLSGATLMKVDSNVYEERGIMFL